MLCREMMRQPVSFCHERNSVQAAAIQMRAAGIGFLPVCDEGEQLRGVVTDRDLALRVCAEGLDARQVPVGEIMTRELVECRPDDDVMRARELMAARQKSRIIVADAHGKLVGVISLADLAQIDPTAAAVTLEAVTAREVVDPHGRVARSPVGGYRHIDP